MSSTSETVSEHQTDIENTESAESTTDSTTDSTESVESVATQASNDESSAPVRMNVAPLDEQKVKNIVEAALMAAGQPLSIDRLLNLFLDENQPSRDELRSALSVLAEECENRGVELVEVGSGFRYQAKQENAEWIARLWEEKPPRYSRALLETLSLIAYRQPITRGEIENIRGVSVSSNIMKTLMERDWVKVVGHRDVPGKPAMYASTKQFLDYFGLKSLSDLPTLAEIRDIDSINAELDLSEPGSEKDDAEPQASAEQGEMLEAATDAVNESEDDTEADAQADEHKEDATLESDDVDVPEDAIEAEADEAAIEKSAVATADPA